MEEFIVASVAVYGHEYNLHSDKINDMGPFDKTYLAEGDSWMDRSSLTQLSLPYYLAMEANARGRSVLIINVAKAGDTMRNISSVMQGEFMWWLKQFTYNGILFSAGGNDFIDAARDAPPGKGLLRDMTGQPLPADGYECVEPAALSALVKNYLDPNFDKLAKAIRASTQNGNTPVYLNCYDTPTARNARAAPDIGPWLYTAYQKNHIDSSLWLALTAGIFRDVKQTVTGFALRNANVSTVPTTGVLSPAAENTTGSSGDWANEIHPNASGWAKLAKVWADELGL